MRNNLLIGTSLAVLLSAVVPDASAKVVTVEGANVALEEATTFASGDKLIINDANYGFIGDNSFDLTFEEGSSAQITATDSAQEGVGIANSGKLTINGGTITANGQKDWNLNNNAQVAGYAGVEMNGGVVNLNGNSAMFAGATGPDAQNMTAYDVDINGGVVHLNGGAILATSSLGTNKININGGEVNVAANQSGQLIAKDINLAGGTINNNGTLNVYASKASAMAGLAGDKEGEADGTLKIGDKGTLNLNNSTVNAKAIEVTGTLDGADDAEKLANAPKINVNGDSTVNSTIGITNGILTVANGSKLTSGDITLNNETSMINAFGNVNANILGTGSFSAKGDNAQVKSLANGISLEVDANTSSTKLVAENSAVKQIYVSNGKTFTIDSEDRLTSDDVVTHGTLNLASDFASAKIKAYENATVNLGNHKLTGDLNLWKNSNYIFNVAKAADGKDIAQAGGVVDGKINLVQNANLNPVVAIDAGSGTYKFANSVDNNVSGGDVNTAWNLVNNNLLYNVALADGSLDTLDINKKDSSEVTKSVTNAGGTSNDAAVVNAWVGGNSNAAALTGNSKAVAEHLNTLAQTNPEALVAATAALAPETNATVQSASTENANQVFSAVGTRLSGGSVSSASNGMSSGDSAFTRGATWVQGLVNKSKLDDTASSKGFDADSQGLALGAEKYVSDNVKVGAGYAYTNTDIDSFMRSTDVDTHTALVYGEYKPSQWYVNGIATYGWSKYDETKNVAGMFVKGDYDVNTFGLQAMTGYEMNMNSYNLTPEVGLRYVRIDQKGYTDTAGQSVDGNKSDILTGVIGAKTSKDFMMDNGMTLRPEARVALTYDMMNDDNNSVVTLANGSAYQVEGKALDRLGFEFGAGVTADVNDNVELSLGYEGKFRQDYQDHTGLVNAKYNF